MGMDYTLWFTSALSSICFSLWGTITLFYAYKRHLGPEWILLFISASVMALMAFAGSYTVDVITASGTIVAYTGNSFLAPAFFAMGLWDICAVFIVTLLLFRNLKLQRGY
jgi:hypothetical protein